MIVLEVELVTDYVEFSEALAELHEAAVRSGFVLQTTINGIDVVVSPNETLANLEQRWQRAWEAAKK